MCHSGTCFDPSNIMCSNKCANPVRPGSHWPDPRDTRCSWTPEANGDPRKGSLPKPFASVYFSNLIAGRALGEADSAFAADFFGGIFFPSSWPDTAVPAMAAATVKHRPNINMRRNASSSFPFSLAIAHSSIDAAGPDKASCTLKDYTITRPFEDRSPVFLGVLLSWR